MTKKRLALILVAFMLVIIGTITLTQIPYKRIYHSIMHPPADAEEVVRHLQDENILQRRLGLQRYHYGLNNDPSVQNALARRVLEDDDEQIRQAAVKILIGICATVGVQMQEQAPLDYNVIEQVVSLLDDVNSPPEISNDGSLSIALTGLLVQFAGNTAKWQTRPQQAIFRITAMLDETSPQANEEQYASYARQERRRVILQAIKGYAHHMMLPQKTLNAVLPIYTDKPASRLRHEAGYIFQYHAIHGPLPANVRKAVVETMRSDPDPQIRLTAIMTMEWIGKQEGQTPAELLEAMKTEGNPKTRQKFHHVIIRIHKHSADPVGSLLTIAGNNEMPVSLRIYALHTAAMDHSTDARTARATLIMTGDAEPQLRMAAISLLTKIAKQPGYPHPPRELLRYVDQALDDADPGVRIAAIYALGTLPISDTEKITRFEQSLLDPDNNVFANASTTISNSGLTSDIINERLALRASSTDAHRVAEIEDTGWWSKLVEIVKDTRQHGVRLFWLLAAAGIITAVGFAVYFVYRFLLAVTDGQRRSGFAAVSALIVWAGLTYGVVAVFVFSAFSFGHNSLVAPGSQFIIDAVVMCVLLIYVFSGWAMRRLLLRQLGRND